MLHQVFVGVGGLQPADERRGSHSVIAIIHQGHQALEITNVMFEALFELHFDCKEVIDVLLKLPSGSVLVIEDLPHLFKAPEQIPRERVEPIVGGTFATGWKHVTQEEVIVRVDSHLVLVLPEMLDGVSGSIVALEARYYELLRETVRGGFLREW